MKKTLILLSLLVLISGLLSGIDDSAIKKFRDSNVYREKKVEIVKFEALKPDIERYQKKSDLDLSKGYYQISKNYLRDTNKVLLNKWLKETK